MTITSFMEKLLFLAVTVLCTASAAYADNVLTRKTIVISYKPGRCSKPEWGITLVKKTDKSKKMPKEKKM